MPATMRRWRAEQTGLSIQAPPLRKVLAKRFVLLIFAYQMLSAMATQLLEYHGDGHASTSALPAATPAHFYGNFTFFLNLADLIFLVLVAGFLLSRFGLKFGLTFNPGAVLLLLAAIVAVGVTTGPAAPLFFGMVLVTRILDLYLHRWRHATSINAAHQALPPHERITVQTGVEGVGVPLALGLTGVSPAHLRGDERCDARARGCVWLDLVGALAGGRCLSIGTTAPIC
ncbi:MAG: hypothetical protein R2851_28155 [Caldilineaceae bacterium]